MQITVASYVKDGETRAQEITRHEVEKLTEGVTVTDGIGDKHDMWRLVRAMWVHLHNLAFPCAFSFRHENKVITIHTAETWQEIDKAMGRS